MADFRKLARHHPAIRAYVKHRRWIDRSGVLAYAPNINGGAFSTDSYGFRRSVFAGKSTDYEAAFAGAPYGLVLGSSHVFGFGLDSDGDTIPSQLAQRCGIPCLNLSFPEASLHALHAVMMRISTLAPRPPTFVALLPGGTLTRYAFVRSCDPLFGVPDFRNGAAANISAGSQAEQYSFKALLGYTRFWTKQIAALAQAQNSAFILHPEYTAFEKTPLSEIETQNGLTVASSPTDDARFATHLLRYVEYTEHLMNSVSDKDRIAKCDPQALTYLDEFHYTSHGAGIVAKALAACLE